MGRAWVGPEPPSSFELVVFQALAIKDYLRTVSVFSAQETPRLADIS